MSEKALRWLDKEGDTSVKTYIVIGCHRGGTSFIAQALKDAGVVLLKLLWGLNNRKEPKWSRKWDF